ncbi:glycosyltransferase family 4 protein [Ramlibacter sp. WS9]|uniref:glycosyltransferase family 4 protein n=1 Tax=Ramlibacter sp. WS9 TaxID=1882741 RepID=UPI00114390B9|nr:glycosyltransferase family 4 protein [Ramlibacter sp. WS9]ROZ66354.1 glycosyltransferase [Ramlibacter sp. WS9]
MAPWFRALAGDAELSVHVIFFREPDAQQQGAGFGQAFNWDVPLRQGYSSHVLDVPAGWRAVPTTWSRLREALLASKPDAVLITGWNEAGLLAAYPLARMLGIPVVLRGEANTLRRRSRLKSTFHRLLLRFASAVTVIGKGNRSFYIAHGVEQHKLFDGAYFVETERMLSMSQMHAAERQQLRARAGFAEDDFVFCFVGKHVAFKRPLLLVQAAALLRDRGFKVKLQFAGLGELTEEIRLRAEDLSVPVHFTGFLNQTELWRAYIPADAFVLPSTNAETWGLVTNEAMLFGLPVVVSSQIGCAQDLVRPGETGYVFSDGAESLADAMHALLQDKAAAAAMGQRARQLVMEHYSMHNATAGLKAALSSVCA